MFPSSASGSPRLRARRVRDTALRTVGIPLLGLLIPRVTQAFAGLTPADPRYWTGTVLFVALSAALWFGNRAILLHLRRRTDWADRPGRKILLILGATGAYTLALAGLTLAGWYATDARPGIDRADLALNLGLILGAVFLLTHVYETMFLINDRLVDRLELERASRIRLQAELGALRSQLTPHFLFNALNTLSVLIDEDRAAARTFNRHLATVCRYLRARAENPLVPLDDELGFFHSYIRLVRLRFGDGVQLDSRGLGQTEGFRLPPASLQLLMENALKHNAFTPADPLRVRLQLEAGRLTFANSLHSPPACVESTGIGLRNLQDRYLLTLGQSITVSRTETEFQVSLPLATDGSAGPEKPSHHF